MQYCHIPREGTLEQKRAYRRRRVEVDASFSPGLDFSGAEIEEEEEEDFFEEEQEDHEEEEPEEQEENMYMYGEVKGGEKEKKDLEMAIKGVSDNANPAHADYCKWINRGDVRFEHVFFRYQPRGDCVLCNLDFTINAGEKIGIVGRTGSGKVRTL